MSANWTAGSLPTPPSGVLALRRRSAAVCTLSRRNHTGSCDLHADT